MNIVWLFPLFCIYMCIFCNPINYMLKEKTNKLVENIE